MHLEDYLLFIVDRCHICFACHFQTVHPIPVIFISISTEITLPLQWHYWISKLRVQSFLSKSCICTAYRIPHIIPCSCVGCLLCCVLLSGVASSGWFRYRRICEDPFDYVCLSFSWTHSSSLRDFRQDDHTLEITSIFAC